MKKKFLLLVASLSSLCGYAQLTPAEGFEGADFPPPGWLIANNGVGAPTPVWVQANGTAQQPAYLGSHAAFLDHENVGAGTVAADYLITKEFTYPTSAELHFFSRLITAGNQNSTFKFYLLDSADTTINPEDVTTYPAPFLTWTENNFNPQTVYTERVIALPAGVVGNNYRVVFGFENDNGDRWLIDQVSVLAKCLEPTNLTAANPGVTSIDLNWDNPSGATSWEIEIVPTSGSTTGSGFIYNGTLPLTATAANGLVAATNYKYYVRALCGDGGVSDWAGPAFFSTNVCAAEDKCDYTFKLSDWYDGWNENTMQVYQNGVLVANLELINQLEGTVTVPLCNAFPFEVSATSGDFIGDSGLQIINPFGQIIYSKEIGENTPLILYQGMADCFVPACLPPQNIVASNSGQTGFDLSWDGPTTGNWEYYIVPQGSTAPTTDTNGTIVTTNPVTINGLNAATNYDIYIRTVCENNVYSTWAGPVQHSTSMCDPSEKCTYYFEMTSNGSGYFGHTMTILQGGATVATIGSTFEEGLTATVAVALCPDAPVDIVWNADADGEFNFMYIGLNVYTPYMEEFFIKPAGTSVINTTIFTGIPSCEAPACLKPQQLYASDITAHTATVGWTEMGTATSWEYYVVPLNSPAPDTSQSGIPITVTTANLSNLQSGTFYTLYVRALCGGDNGNSSWSVAYIFVTDIENDECTGATTIPVNSGVQCNQSITGTLDGSTASGNMPSCIIDGVAADVWYQFTATAPAHTITIASVGATFAYAAVYQGSNCGNLDEMSCTQNPITMVNNLTIGATYYIKVFVEYIEEQTSTQFTLCVTTPAPILVTDVFENEEVTAMVNDVLVTAECAQVSNISFSGNGLGKFQKGNSAFAISEGVVLSTGIASSAMGPNFSKLSEGDENWLGDTDLFNYMQTVNSDPSLMSHVNATVLEFDFIPFTNHISFPFIFASEEYGMYQCEFSDAFAFFLTDLTDNTPTTNLAVLPDTTIPVSVTTIRDIAYNPACVSANPQYFDTYYGDLGGGADPLTSPTNFEGNTVQLLAQSDVVSGHTYHIKLVIADEGDFAYDSAVFIGSFNVGGVNLGPDISVQNGTALCFGESYTIHSNLSTADYSFEWFYNGTLITGENNPYLVVTQTGEYMVKTHDLNTFCDNTDIIFIEFYNVLQSTGTPIDLTACDTSGYAAFNLSVNTAALLQGLNPANFIITYHATQEDANANTNPLNLNYVNAMPNQQTIFVRIYNSILQCTGIKTFSLIVNTTAPQFDITTNFAICQGNSGTISVTPLNFDGSAATYSWTLNSQPLADTTASITATQAGTYAVTVNVAGCTTIKQVVITVVSPPIANILPNVFACSYTLPELSADNIYYTASGGLGTNLAPGTVITTTQTIYIYAVNPTLGCSSESSFTITILPTATLEITQGCEDANYTLKAVFDNDANNSGNVSFVWTNAGGIVLGSESQLIITLPGTYYVTATPNAATGCPVTADVTVTNVACMIPKGISPNGDDKNDSFDLTGFDINKLSIFNRYGMEVYSKITYTSEWHGQTNEGGELPTGTYYYVITFSSGSSKTGWVYINRQEK
ncbi:choice-of-anchor L domain-containing protein [Flavobacterium subsaxonicum]|uniref:Fibronectin n=1 Tax=Flavobacterium subsaxonicum WB 4.1-42 = DSM 21790 TaxID=1121898 RepID=A0A0A2MNL3_9FLAO|nr:choice-of-anchor L domain-containing protein [Flavobacterium subsaxonicum]KGO93919.1 hypothetical protein Q766_05920 [Flavobacterium subsaxonicum WB 4.1-42 = DSM 21790]